MAYKEFQLSELGTVKVYKRRGSRSLRLSVTAAGDVRVTIPAWTAYAAGLNFAKARQQWILARRPVSRECLCEGQLIGKAHRLHFVAVDSAAKVSTRLRQTEITIRHPQAMPASHPSVQSAAQAAGIRALRLQAEQLLPQRLAALATQHGFTYKSVSVRRLKSRWGSCDQHRHITLNLYLMQLPWQLIDYVLLHELTHTEVMQHGPKFWETMARMVPNLPELRKAIRVHRPLIGN
jgi:predicted metal-dependent hydrolase